MGMKWGQGAEPERVYQKHSPVAEQFPLAVGAELGQDRALMSSSLRKGLGREENRKMETQGIVCFGRPLKVQNDKLLLAVSFIQM